MKENYWKLIFRLEDKATFNKIKSGEKTVEPRALDPHNPEKSFYGEIVSGDTIEFICGKESFVRSVKDLRKYHSLAEFLENESLELIFGKGISKETAEKSFNFPGYKERLEKHGIVAIELNQDNVQISL